MAAKKPNTPTLRSRFEELYAEWAGTTPDQIEGLRLSNGSYSNPKVSHCWHFYQLDREPEAN